MPELSKNFASLPIAKKILWLNAAAATVTAVILIVLKVASVYMMARSELLADTRVGARIAAEGSAYALAHGDREAAQQMLGALRNSADIFAAAIYDQNGQLAASYSALGGNVPLPSLKAGESYRFGPDQLEVVSPISVSDREQGKIVVWASLEPLSRAVFYNGLVTALITIAGFSVILALLWKWVPAVLKPLSVLTELTSEISKGRDYSLRALVNSQDEVGKLSEGLNSMLDQICARDAALQAELGEREMAERKFAYLAHHDSVTGRPNRHFFNEHIVHAVARAERSNRPLALMFLDLDNFKNVNDNLGHPTGDALLKMVAQRFESALRSSDVVCRIGGDEFAVIAEELEDELAVCLIAEKLIGVLGAPFALGGHEVNISVSAGVALAKTHGNDVETLINNADTALYQAKALGKARFQLFKPAMATGVIRRLSLETALRKALERDEFEVLYQPQIHLKSGRLVSLEALLRWRHPEIGPVSPSEFIPVAEETGLIIPIGDWVLRTALTAAKGWQGRGLPSIGVAVNVSARQLSEAGFVANLMATIGSLSLDSHFVELEVTESVLADAAKYGFHRLDELHRYGINLCIDDFGSGHSSLNYLKRVAISRIKINPTFVAGAPNNRNDAAITAGVIGLAHNLGLQVTAEGIETEEQLEYLRNLQCDRGQGFKLGRPLPYDLVIADYAQALSSNVFPISSAS